MKILFAANRFPYPPFRGDKLKIYNLAKKLSQHHELHLLTFLQDTKDEQYIPELKKVFKEVHLVPHTKVQAVLQTFRTVFSGKPLQVGYFRNKKMKEKIDDLLSHQQYDAVHIQHLRLAQYWKNKTSLPRILDLPDAYSLYWKRRVKSSSGLKRLFNLVEFKRVRAYEDILNKFDLTLVCSEEDQGYLKKEKNIKAVSLLPNGVDCQQFHFPENDYSENMNILFTGNMDYAPNVDAVVYFAEEIFPLILKAIPDARFTIAGQRPVDKVLNLKSHNIHVTGFIEDLSAVYKTAAIVVAPLRFGAGTQNKVLEAMATGIPVVTRNIGFKGLGIQNREGAILALSTVDFANACIELLQDRSLREQVGTKGRQLIEERYDWSAIAQQLEYYFHHTIRHHKTTTDHGK